MSFTKTLSRWIVDLRYEHLPFEVVPWVKAAVTDYFAVALAGCPAAGLKIVRRHVWSQYAGGECAIIGDTDRMSAEAAALYNGGMRQTLIDDFAKIPAIVEKLHQSNIN